MQTTVDFSPTFYNWICYQRHTLYFGEQALIHTFIAQDRSLQQTALSHYNIVLNSHNTKILADCELVI